MLNSGDIVITPFVYADLKGLKVRPALVINAEDFTQETGLVIVAAISSKPIYNRYEILINEWQAAGLKMPSKVSMGRIATINANLVKQIGTLSEPDSLSVQQLKEKTLY